VLYSKLIKLVLAMLPKTNRLSNRIDIEKVLTKGHSFFSKHAGLKFIKNGKDTSRFVVIISLKISKKAVVRNKLRRKLLNIILEYLPDIKTSFDVIILTRPILVNLKYQELKQEINYLLKNSKLI